MALGSNQDPTIDSGVKVRTAVCLDFVHRNVTMFICPHCERIVGGEEYDVRKAYFALVGYGQTVNIVRLTHKQADSVAELIASGALRSGQTITFAGDTAIPDNTDTTDIPYPHDLPRGTLCAQFANGAIPYVTEMQPTRFWYGKNWPGIDVVLYHNEKMATPTDVKAYESWYDLELMKSLEQER